MAEKNAVLRALLGGIVYELMVRSNVYSIRVDESTTLADKLQEIVTALNGKVKISDIVDSLDSSETGKPLSAAAGARLKGLIDGIPQNEIPTKLSQFTNDVGYITNAVADLVNYYRKNETYSREEVDEKISAIPKFTISVVTELPATDISETTIYLVPGGNGTDLYTEFIRVDGKWEILGSQKLDLTGYATESWVRAGYQPKGDYALVSQIPSVPTNVSAFQNDAGYLTEHQDISGKLDADKLPEAVGGEIATFGAVSYNEQTLTEEQKAQARANIGSVSGEELEEAKPFFVPVEVNEDDGSASTEVPFADIVSAYASNRLVYALVGGLFQLPLAGVDEEMVLFLLNAGQSIVMVQLNADGTGFYQMIEDVGGSGEAETFVVPFTEGDNGFVTEVAFEDVLNAYNSGQFVYATFDGIGQASLETITDTEAYFTVNTPEFGAGLTFHSDGTVEVDLLQSGGGSLIVTVTGEGDNLTADVPFEQIISAIASGGTVIAIKDEAVLYPGRVYSESVMFFSCMPNAIDVLMIGEAGTAQYLSTQLVRYSDLDNWVMKGEFSDMFNSKLDGRMPDIVADVIAQLPSDEDLTYVQSEAEAVARIVNQHQSNDSIVFPFLADAHCGYYLDTEEQATKLAGQLLDLIGKRVPFDFVANGGDISAGAWDTTREKTYEHCEDYTELTAAGQHGVPSLWVPGNHDDAPYMATAERLSQKDVFLLIGRKSRLSGAAVPNGCNYGYLDLENRKLRVICLDTDDKRGWGTVAVGSGGTAPAYLNAHNVGGAQLQWLAGEALDFSGKENPEDWGIVVISHVALNVSGSITDAVSGETYAHSTKNAAVILKDYMSGKSGSVTHNGITASYDFASLQSRAAVICAVHGHNHNFSHETLEGGILSIGCPNVMNGRERVSEDGNTYTKTAGTADGTSFCILTVDRENCLIYADCVGVGYDREFAYTTEVISYTNQLPISTDASGNVYNGKGWKENTYLSSGNDGARDGIYATGFLPIAVNEYGSAYFYCKNVGLQTGQDSHRVCVYNADKSLRQQYKSTIQGAPFTAYGEDGNISVISFPSTTFEVGGFIRLCCGYLGPDSIITSNEPIE